MAVPFRFQIGHLKVIDHLILGFAADCNAREKILPQAYPLCTKAFASWNQIRESLIAGEINAAFITIPEALDLFSKGMDIRLLMFTHRGGGFIIKKKTPAIRNLSDFKGKSVLIPSQLSVQHMLLHRLINSAGASLHIHPGKDAHVLAETAAPCLMPEILDQDPEDDFAGFAAPEPYGTIAVQAGSANRLCRTGDLWQNHPCSALILHQDTIERSPEAILKLVSLFRRTAEFLEQENLETLCPTAARFLGLTEELTAEVLSTSGACFCPDLLHPDIQVVQTIQDYMADVMGVLEKKAVLDQFLAPEFFTENALDHVVEN